MRPGTPLVASACMLACSGTVEESMDDVCHHTIHQAVIIDVLDAGVPPSDDLPHGGCIVSATVTIGTVVTEASCGPVGPDCHCEGGGHSTGEMTVAVHRGDTLVFRGAVLAPTVTLESGCTRPEPQRITLDVFDRDGG